MFDYINFINKYCCDDTITKSLYNYFIKKYKDNIIINNILEQYGILTDEFNEKFKIYNDYLFVYLKAKYEYNYIDLPTIPQTQQECIEEFYNKGEGKGIWISFQDIYSKYQAPYFYIKLKDYLKGSILDIGGCSGSLTNAFWNYNNSLDVTVFDLPGVIENVEKYDNIKYIEGDLLDYNLENYDVAICKDFLKCLSRADAYKIINKIKYSVNTIIIMEPMGGVLDKRDQPFFIDQWILESLFYNSADFYLNIAMKNNLKVQLIDKCEENGYTSIVLTK